MIEKLSKRIFLLIMISLSIIVLGIIILFAFFNYNNTINTANLFMDRFIGGEPRRGPNDRGEFEKIRPEIDLEGLYYIIVEDAKIVQNSNNSSNAEVEKYAIKIAKTGKQKGIIGSYIYKTKKIKENTISVTFMENEKAISHIKAIFMFSAFISIIFIIVIFYIAKKISKIIVRPVEETFEKQKQFISDASHELKTPLAVIEANTDVLENEVGSNKWMKYIQNELEAMDKLINELLLLAKVEDLHNFKEYKRLDMSKEVELIFSMFESMAYEKQVIIMSQIQDNIYFNGNKEDIEHIVSVLTDNAIKHTDVEKKVIVELQKDKNEIILEVKNEGKPIPDDERKRIFERFYRIDKSRNRGEKRYGLGLAIAKSLVDNYNGKIEVLYKEGFTIFRVSFPS